MGDKGSIYYVLYMLSHYVACESIENRKINDKPISGSSHVRDLTLDTLFSRQRNVLGLRLESKA